MKIEWNEQIKKKVKKSQKENRKKEKKKKKELAEDLGVCKQEFHETTRIFCECGAWLIFEFYIFQLQLQFHIEF